MDYLPPDCVAHILFYTSTPADVCMLSMVSKTFCSAAEYDTVWGRFIPSDLSSVTSTFISSSFNSKKHLFHALSNHPTIIDDGRKSFQLDKRSGSKCYMISARALNIVWGNHSQYWEWINLPESRFEEVAKLYAVCWFDISGGMNTRVLSPNTLYAVFLVFKMVDASGFQYEPVLLKVGFLGGISSSKHVCLEDDEELDDSFRGLQRPTVRTDGWLEIEMGEFFNSGLEEDELQVSVAETTSNMWKHGFIIEGIEIRPKHG